MRCQALGKAWQNACTIRSGSGMKAASAVKITPDVPSERKACPGAIQPSPTAPAALSPAPPATGQPTGNPNSAATTGRSRPDSALPSTNDGMWRSVSPVADSIASDQRRRPTSSHSVPAASDISDTTSPVRRSRNQSLGSRTRAVRAKISGSCRRTHSSLGAVKPGIARLPVIAAERSSVASSSAHSACARPSFHRIAGRSTRSASSSSTAPCICPHNPMARTPDRSCSARRSPSAASSAAHQASGSCSFHCARGEDRVSGAPACATMAPSPPTSTAFSDDVPRSMPRYI